MKEGRYIYPILLGRTHRVRYELTKLTKHDSSQIFSNFFAVGVPLVGGTQKVLQRSRKETGLLVKGFLFPKAKGKMRLPPTLEGDGRIKSTGTALI